MMLPHPLVLIADAKKGVTPNTSVFSEMLRYKSSRAVHRQDLGCDGWHHGCVLARGARYQ